MATNIDTVFETEWSVDVKQAYQDEYSKLRMCIKNVNNANGEVYNFHTLGAVDANTKARHAEVTPLDIQHGEEAATIADSFAPIYIDKLDQLKTSPDFRREYVMAVAKALGRKIDDDIITSLATSTVSAPTTAAGLTFAKVLEGHELLNQADVPLEDRYFVHSSQALTEALQIENLTDADYNNLYNVMTGQVQGALGMTWIRHSRLPLATTNRSNFMMHKDAVGVAFGQDLTTEVNYIPQRVSTLVNAFLSFGVAMIEDAGVVEVITSEA